MTIVTRVVVAAEGAIPPVSQWSENRRRSLPAFFSRILLDHVRAHESQPSMKALAIACENASLPWKPLELATKRIVGSSPQDSWGEQAIDLIPRCDLVC